MIEKKDLEILEKYGRILNKEVKNEKLDPVIGRESEIRRIIEILSRKKKNNPVLIGEAGVGKTAIVEGLTQRIVKRDVPKNLFDKVIFELSISALLSGTKFQGEFEERLKKITDLLAKNSDILMFIDELHLIVGAGKTQGAIDLANILKPMLTRGELRAIGSTTIDEYRQYIEKDTALERRFQTILVEEPTIAETITILRGLKRRYEVFHEVSIKDNALVSAAKLSAQYIPQRNLPDKALDLIDETCAKIKTEIWSVPEKLDEMRRKVTQLSIEENALSREEEKDLKTEERLQNVHSELEKLNQIKKKLEAQWNQEKQTLQIFTNSNRQISKTQKEYEEAVERGDLEKAGEIKYQILPKLIYELEKLKKQKHTSNQLLKSFVDENLIANTVSQWTKIPVHKLLTDEKKQLLNLAQKIKMRVCGQDPAVQAVADAILRSRTGINDPKRPIASFLFLGGTGVGKSLLAKVLADLVFSSTKNLIRIDMSEYNASYSVSRLIGSPPGYVGYEAGGQLTEKIKHKPYAVILFDELEKAHPEVQKILLQILEEGELTDGLGKKISFKNTIIIITSNINSELIAAGEETNIILQKLQTEISPELYNRFNEIIIFNPLNDLIINEIIQLELQAHLKNLLENQNINFQYDETVLKKIKTQITTYQLGARPIKHFIERRIITKIAKWLLTGEVKENESYLLSYQFDLEQFVLKKAILN